MTKIPPPPPSPTQDQSTDPESPAETPSPIQDPETPPPIPIPAQGVTLRVEGSPPTRDSAVIRVGQAEPPADAPDRRHEESAEPEPEPDVAVAVRETIEDVTDRQVRQLLETQGEWTNMFLGRGSERWLWDKRELDRVAPALAAMAGRSKIARAIAGQSDLIAVISGVGHYLVRNIVDAAIAEQPAQPEGATDAQERPGDDATGAPAPGGDVRDLAALVPPS